MPTKVLAFHHVSATPRVDVGPDADVRISPERFRAVLEEHGGWEPVDVPRAMTDITTGTRRLLVTFDDGYRDNLTEALPVLEALDVPCVMFVVTGYLDGTVRPLESDLGWILDHLSPDVDRRGRYAHECRRLLGVPPAARPDALAALAEACDAPWPAPTEDLFLSWEDVARLHEHPLVTIGSHTVSHPRLTKWQHRLAAEEATRSRQRLEETLGATVDCLAYPYGRHGRLICRAAASAGYRYAFTTRPRLVESGFHPHAVPRFVSDEPVTARRAA